MDLLSSIRKSGSRGGVDFQWSDVSTSQHRENYLGHSLMAPVGRWQKNKDLSWYAKGDKGPVGTETAEEQAKRERKEEIMRIKEAEEDALARALGLPVKDRSGSGGMASGANNIAVGDGELRGLVKETEEGDDEVEAVGRQTGLGGMVGGEEVGELQVQGGVREGGLLSGGERKKHRSREERDGGRRRDGSRDRSRDRDGRSRRHRHRERSSEREPRGGDGRSRREQRHRSRSRSQERRRRHRSRSGERRKSRREDREREPTSRRSQSPRRRGSEVAPDRRRDGSRDRERRR